MTGFSFLEGEDPASPEEDEKPRVEWKRSRAKTSQASHSSRAAEALHRSARQTPQTATGLQEVRHACVSTRFSVISLAAKASQSEQSVNRKTAA